MSNSQLAIFPEFAPPLQRKVESATDRKIRLALSKEKKALAAKRIFEPLEKRISFTPDGFTIYTDYSILKAREGLARAYNAKAVERKYNTGRLSRGAASKMKLAGSHLFLISKPKKIKNSKTGKYFYVRQSTITLTLSEKQKHKDNWIKANMLGRFLDTLQHRYPGISLWWKAERQGPDAWYNIHFHIVTDHFIPYQYVADLWNGIQKRCGYLDKWAEKKVKEFKKKIKSSNGELIDDGVEYQLYSPPSTETKKVRGEAQMALYMRKYLAKSFREPEYYLEEIERLKKKFADIGTGKIEDLDKRRWKRLHQQLKEAQKPIIEGKLWGCTDNLLLDKMTIEHPEDFFAQNHAVFLYGKKVPMEQDNFEYYKFEDYEAFLRTLDPGYKKDFKNHYSQLLNPHRPPETLILETGLNYSYKKKSVN